MLKKLLFCDKSLGETDKYTFREVIEDFCLQESVPCVPCTSGAQTHVDGKQVFLFGGIYIYLDADAQRK